MRNPSWPAIGTMAGLAFGLVEGLLTFATSDGLPPVVALLLLLVGGGAGLLIGVILRIVAPDRRAPRPESAAVYPGVGLVLFVLGSRTLFPSLEESPLRSWSIGLVGAVVVLLAGWLGARIARRLVGEELPVPALCAAWLLTSAWIAGTRWSANDLFRGYSDPRTVGVSLGLALVTAWCTAALLRRRWTPAWRERAAGLVAPLLLTAGALLLTGGAGLAALAPASESPVPEAVPSPPPGADRLERPSILLVTIDTLRADHLPLYGYGRNTAPFLTELASGATVYERALSPSSWTLPAHASLFTGRLPHRHGADSAREEDGRLVAAEPRPLTEDATTLAELLREAGYQTGAVVANFGYLGESFGFAQGFSLYDDAPRLRLGYSSVGHDWLEYLAPLAYRRLTNPYRSATEVTEAAIAWLAGQRPEVPFFLFVNYMDTHDPHAPPRPYDRLFPGARPFVHSPYAQVMAGERPATEVERRHFTALYDGEIAQVDAELRRLAGALRELGRWGSTLVVVTSDHGEFFGEHDRWYHGYGPFEPVHAVPLVVRRPAGEAARVPRPVSIMDLFPSLLREAGLPVPEGLDAAPLDAPGRPPVLEQYVYADLVSSFGERFERAYAATYEGSFKLVAYSDGALALYDLARDPGETRDVAASHPELVERLRPELDAVLQAMVAGAATGKAVLDPETRKRLEALGYL